MTISTEDAYKALGAGWVETQHGQFDPMHPVFDIRDIAHSLGQLTRYNGHGKFFYSVAEHSVMVARLIAMLHLDASPLAGLMHDATEAYDMLPSRGEGWTDPLNLRPLALELRASGDFKAEGWAPKFASREFLRYFSAPQPSLAVPVGALCAA